jgi:anti-sigma-K factor RskA
MTEQHANPEDFDLYALGALDGKEQEQFETHLRACTVCRSELALAHERALLLGLAATPLNPPPSIKSALMQRVRAERPIAARRITPNQPRIMSWGMRFSLAFASAAVILAIATTWLWQQNQQRQGKIQSLQAELSAAKANSERSAAQAQAVTEVVGAPDTVQVTLLQQAGGPPGQARVLYNARMGLVIYSGEIAPEPADKSYQLWLVPSSGAPVNAGLVAASQQNEANVVHLQQGLVAKAFAITLEPRGGRPQPTGPKVLIGAIRI